MRISKKKRSLAFMLVVLMLVSLMPTFAFAADGSADQIQADNGGYLYQPFDDDTKESEGAASNVSTNKAEQTDGASGGAVSVEVSKTITPSTTKENEFTIKLEVVTTENVYDVDLTADAAVVLVIDASGSMNWNDEGLCAEQVAGKTCNRGSGSCSHYFTDGSSRLQKAQAAAIAFAEDFAKDANGASRMISVVTFSSSAATALSWTDATTMTEWGAATPNSIEAAIGGITASGGTYIDEGLDMANTLLTGGSLTAANGGDAISAKYVVLMTDGAPSDGTTSPTASATIVKNNGAILYTMGYAIDGINCTYRDGTAHKCNEAGWHQHDNASDRTDNGYGDGRRGRLSDGSFNDCTGDLFHFHTCSEHWFNGPHTGVTYGDSKTGPVADWLASIATSPDHSINASNGNSVQIGLADIARRIQQLASAWRVIDPMGEFIVLAESSFSNSTGVSLTKDDSKTTGFTWDLTTLNPTAADGKYTYTLTYDISLDTAAAGFKETDAEDNDIYYLTNGYTYLDYYFIKDVFDGDGNLITSDGKDAVNTISFNVPAVKGEIPTVDYTIEYYYYDQTAGDYVKDTSLDQSVSTGGSVKLWEEVTIDETAYSKTNYVYDHGDDGVNQVTQADQVFKLYYDRSATPVDPATVTVKHVLTDYTWKLVDGVWTEVLAETQPDAETVYTSGEGVHVAGEEYSTSTTHLGYTYADSATFNGTAVAESGGKVSGELVAGANEFILNFEKHIECPYAFVDVTVKHVYKDTTWYTDEDGVLKSSTIEHKDTANDVTVSTKRVGESYTVEAKPWCDGVYYPITNESSVLVKEYTLTAEGLEITLIYEKADLPMTPTAVTVNHYYYLDSVLQDTLTKNVTVDKDIYAKVSYTASAIGEPGYVLTSAEPSMSITLDADPSKNVINLYYDKTTGGSDPDATIDVVYTYKTYITMVVDGKVQENAVIIDNGSDGSMNYRFTGVVGDSFTPTDKPAYNEIVYTLEGDIHTVTLAAGTNNTIELVYSRQLNNLVPTNLTVKYVYNTYEMFVDTDGVAKYPSTPNSSENGTDWTPGRTVYAGEIITTGIPAGAREGYTAAAENPTLPVTLLKEGNVLTYVYEKKIPLAQVEVSVTHNYTESIDDVAKTPTVVGPTTVTKYVGESFTVTQAPEGYTYQSGTDNLTAIDDGEWTSGDAVITVGSAGNDVQLYYTKSTLSSDLAGITVTKQVAQYDSTKAYDEHTYASNVTFASAGLTGIFKVTISPQEKVEVPGIYAITDKYVNADVETVWVYDETAKDFVEITLTELAESALDELTEDIVFYYLTSPINNTGSYKNEVSVSWWSYSIPQNASASASATITASWGGGSTGGGTPTTNIEEEEVPLSNFIEDHYAYVIGYPDGNVRPQGTLTRAEASTVFFRLLTDMTRTLNWTQENDFSDVNSGDWFNNAISVMSNMEILNGYETGDFKPNSFITRGELATIAAKFARLEGSEVISEPSFGDIEGHWAETDILYAASVGWLDGDDDGNFRPADQVTRAEFMALVNRMLARAPETAEDLLKDEMIKWPDNANESAWFYLDVQEATNSHEHEEKETQVPGRSFNYETWTAMLPARDWSLLEKEWSTANSAGTTETESTEDPDSGDGADAK